MMIITTVEEAIAPGFPGRVLDCFEAGEVAEVILCGGEITLVRPGGEIVEIIDSDFDFGNCPRCGAENGQPHSCENPL